MKWVKAGVTGDGRAAVVELATSEPVQYFVEHSSPERLLERWEEILEALSVKASAR